MCNAIAYGGQRCAYHTREDYAAAIATVKQTGFRPQISDLDRLEVAATYYASTPEGHQVVAGDIERSEQAQQWDHAALLRAALVKGRALAEANQATVTALETVVAQRAYAQVGENPENTHQVRVTKAQKAQRKAQRSGRVEDEQRAAFAAAEAGAFRPGDRVVVARGRKVPRGVEGALIHVHTKGQYGPRALIRQTNGEDLWVSLANLDRVEAPAT